MTYDEVLKMQQFFPDDEHIKQRVKIMKTLGCSREEAEEILKTDKLIDKGADPFPLTTEQKEVEKQMRQADRKKETAPRQRERKADADKREIILSLNSFLIDFVHEYDEDCIDDDVCMTNPERQIDFTFRGKKYRIVLSAPRK